MFLSVILTHVTTVGHVTTTNQDNLLVNAQRDIGELRVKVKQFIQAGFIDFL